jgi:hypothetical protein
MVAPLTKFQMEKMQPRKGRPEKQPHIQNKTDLVTRTINNG